MTGQRRKRILSVYFVPRTPAMGGKNTPEEKSARRSRTVLPRGVPRVRAARPGIDRKPQLRLRMLHPSLCRQRLQTIQLCRAAASRARIKAAETRARAGIKARARIKEAEARVRAEIRARAKVRAAEARARAEIRARARIKEAEARARAEIRARARVKEAEARAGIRARARIKEAEARARAEIKARDKTEARIPKKPARAGSQGSLGIRRLKEKAKAVLPDVRPRAETVR